MFRGVRSCSDGGAKHACDQSQRDKLAVTPPHSTISRMTCASNTGDIKAELRQSGLVKVPPGGWYKYHSSDIIFLAFVNFIDSSCSFDFRLIKTSHKVKSVHVRISDLTQSATLTPEGKRSRVCCHDCISHIQTYITIIILTECASSKVTPLYESVLQL